MIQTARLILPQLIKTKKNFFIIIEAFFHLLSPVCYISNLIIFSIIFALPFLGTPFRENTFYLNLFSLILMFSFISFSFFFYIPYRIHIKKISYLKFLSHYFAVIAILCSNSINAMRAMIEGTFGISSEFIRTSKHRQAAAINIGLKDYYKKPDWTLGLDLIFLFFILYSFIMHLNTPFSFVYYFWLSIFFFGFLYSLFHNLKEEFSLNFIHARKK